MGLIGVDVLGVGDGERSKLKSPREFAGLGVEPLVPTSLDLPEFSCCIGAISGAVSLAMLDWR